MTFMQQEIAYSQWYEVEDTDGGTYWYDAHLFSRDEVKAFGVIKSMTDGWGARLSAPGYLDCTDWCVFETEAEATEYLDDTYGDDE